MLPPVLVKASQRQRQQHQFQRLPQPAALNPNETAPGHAEGVLVGALQGAAAGPRQAVGAIRQRQLQLGARPLMHTSVKGCEHAALPNRLFAHFFSTRVRPLINKALLRADASVLLVRGEGYHRSCPPTWMRRRSASCAADRSASAACCAASCCCLAAAASAARSTRRIGRPLASGAPTATQTTSPPIATPACA